MEDLQIIPIGVNYTDSNAFRSELMIEVGEAIQMRDYLATYRDNGQRAIRELTDELARRLAQHLIIIDRPERKNAVDRDTADALYEAFQAFD